jgi:hypothetical protein
MINLSLRLLECNRVVCQLNTQLQVPQGMKILVIYLLILGPPLHVLQISNLRSDATETIRFSTLE